jgi:hypothetical protein
MEIDFEKWHDGLGYDLDALRLASQNERIVIERMLIHHSPRDCCNTILFVWKSKRALRDF